MSLKIIGCWRKGKTKWVLKETTATLPLSRRCLKSTDSQGNVFSSKASFIIRKSTALTHNTLSVIKRFLYYLWKINRPFRLENRSLIKIDKNRKKRDWLGIVEVQFQKLNLCHTLGFLPEHVPVARFWLPEFLWTTVTKGTFKHVRFWERDSTQNRTSAHSKQKKKTVVIVKHNETLPQLPTRWAPFCLENNF